MKYEDLENIKADCLNAVVFNLHQIKHGNFVGGDPVQVYGDQSIPGQLKKHVRKHVRAIIANYRWWPGYNLGINNLSMLATDRKSHNFKHRELLAERDEMESHDSF